MRYPQSLQGQVDVLLVHGDGRSPQEKAKRVAELRDAQRPVLMTEDDNGRATTVEHLAGDLASCDIFYQRRRLGLLALDSGAAISFPLSARRGGRGARRHA